jgi:hypothetical protein
MPAYDNSPGWNRTTGAELASAALGFTEATSNDGAEGDCARPAEESGAKSTRPITIPASPTNIGAISLRLSGLFTYSDIQRTRIGAGSRSGPDRGYRRFTADAVHLATAYEIGEIDIWTNDHHKLAAASWFGLTGRSV